jgi:PRD1 phage membrane DNA delivery
VDTITKVALAIVTLGLAATLVVNGPNTAKVIQAGTSGFSNSLSAAEKG